MIEKVLVINRKTGREKWVPAGTAEMMKNEDFLKKDWEVPKPGSPTPNEVVKFIERKHNDEELQPKVVEFEKESEDGLSEAGCKKTCKDLESKLREAEAIVEELSQEKAKIDAHVEFRAKEEKAVKEDLSLLSVKKLADRIEYLTLDQLEGLKTDERVSVVRMVEKELKKREDEKGNTGN